jgi:hypothetical protein
MRQAGEALADLTAVSGRAGDLAIGAARVPVRTGRLAGSLTSVPSPAGVSLQSSLVYAGPIHNGWPAHNIAANPFLANAVTARQDGIVGLYADELETVIGRVHGA